MDTEDYAPIVEAGAEGLVVYQETYNRGVYAEMHTAGPKRDFNYRLNCAERGYALAESPAGEPLTSAEAARAEDRINLRFADGRVEVRKA